jgi:hypothetical protein
MELRIPKVITRKLYKHNICTSTVCGRTEQNETKADYENGGLSLFGDI